jgi:hypothetical protein
MIQFRTKKQKAFMIKILKAFCVYFVKENLSNQNSTSHFFRGLESHHV